MTDFPNWFDVTAKDNFEKYVPSVPNLKVLQIGVYTGDATEWLLNSRDIKALIDVDTWGGSGEEGHETIDFTAVGAHYDKRFAGKFDKEGPIEKHKMDSDAFFEEERSFIGSDAAIEYDFIYIDGDHTATQTALDGLNAFQFLTKGGVIAFDDLTWRSGKGRFYDPLPGIEAFQHVCHEQVELIVANSQAWFKKK